MPRSIRLAALLAVALTAACGTGAAKPAASIPAASRTAVDSISAAPPAATSASGMPGSSGLTTGAPSTRAPSTAARSSATVPRFDHIVVVVLENHAYSQVVGSRSAPYLNSLAARGAVLTRSYAVTHPSQPNYTALFAGSTQGLTDDSCPHEYSGPNLAAALLAAGNSFVGYSEDLPTTGFAGCSAGAYARKHNPWVNFGALPKTVNQPLTSFPRDLSRLPTVAFVIPNLDNDMHDGTVGRSDRWLRTHLGAYAAWSTAHNSLLIITADEDDTSHDNRIATIFAGAHVRPGRYGGHIDHYDVLATLLAGYRLAPFGRAAQAAPITAVWAG